MARLGNVILVFALFILPPAVFVLLCVDEDLGGKVLSVLGVIAVTIWVGFTLYALFFGKGGSGDVSDHGTGGE